MEKLDLILYLMSAGFTITFGLMIIVWNSLNQRISESHNSLSCRIDRLDEKLTDIDRRLCRLEGAFSAKDCCVIKDDRHMRKAE